MRLPHWLLRTKLIVACVLVQLAAGTLLVLASSALLERTLLEQARSATRQVVAILDQAIAIPLSQRDYATLQQTIDLLRNDAAIVYIVLWDHRGRVIASAGWDVALPLPARDGAEIDLTRADETLHVAVPIVVSDQVLGRADLGLSTASLREARATFLRRSVGIGLAALLISMLLLGVIALAITRHLSRLAQATRRVGEGDYDVQVPVQTNDEIGRLGLSFNAMAAALKQRVAALEQSRAQQRIYLAEVQHEQSRLTTLLGAMQTGIVFVDAEGRVIYANDSFARLWSIPPLNAGQSMHDIVPRLASQLEPGDIGHLEALRDPDIELTVAGRELRLLDGRLIVQRMQPVTQGIEGSGTIWFHDDVTQERQTQRRAHQALEDPLTALFNRRGLYESLRSAIAQAAGTRAEVALLYVDLDDFKHANDVAGHRTGDDILVAVARALSAQMRQGETVARIGGDEFAVLCPGSGAADAGAIAGRLVEAVSALRFPTSAQTLQVACSVGVATYPGDARTADDLVACADAAMYEAKQDGKNGWAAYRDDPLRGQAESSRTNWNARIHRALHDERFVLHFQSVRRAADLGIVHHEALVRMVDENEPTRLISPVEFIAHAERSGRIRQIDRWVFEACVARLATEAPDVCIAANLSARSLEDASFPGFLRTVLQRHDVDPRRLLIELTETSAISDPLAARRMIDALRGLGSSVHLDDFGSGFSSFAHLKLLDVDTIKIDGIFIRNLQSDSSNRLFVAAMIEIAHNLNKVVVAEQVEDEGTLAALRGLGVDLVQGFHFGRPSPRLVDAAQPPRLQVVSERQFVPVRGGSSG